MHSAPTPARTTLQPTAFVLFVAVLFFVIATRTDVVGSFSPRMGALVALVIALLAVVVGRFKTIPRIVEWLLFLSRPLALVMCFRHPAALMLAATSALLKGLVVYFFALAALEGAGRQRLLLDLGLLPLAPRDASHRKQDFAFAGSLGFAAAIVFLVPGWSAITTLALWILSGGFIALDTIPSRNFGENHGRKG